MTSRAITIGAYPAESCDYVCFAPLRHYRNSPLRFSFFTALFSWMTNKNLQHDHCSSICNALMMITGVIETFAICRLYRFLWPWFPLKGGCLMMDIIYLFICLRPDRPLNTHEKFSRGGAKSPPNYGLACVRVHFLRWNKSNLKIELEWQTKQWTIYFPICTTNIGIDKGTTLSENLRPQATHW